MHLGQIGLEQIWHFSVETCPGCLRQGWPSALGSEAAWAAGDGASILRPNRGLATCGTAAAEPVTGTGLPAGLVFWPSSRRTRLSTKSEASVAHAGHTNCTGLRAISGVISNSYFAPQEHCTFMGHPIHFHRRES